METIDFEGHAPHLVLNFKRNHQMEEQITITLSEGKFILKIADLKSGTIVSRQILHMTAPETVATFLQASRARASYWDATLKTPMADGIHEKTSCILQIWHNPEDIRPIVTLLSDTQIISYTE